jgi:pimeloyl-ACP methyl ester carboxylesterase
MLFVVEEETITSRKKTITHQLTVYNYRRLCTLIQFRLSVLSLNPMSRSKYFSSLLVAGAIMGCSEDVTSDTAPEAIINRYFIHADSVGSIPVETLRGMASYAGQQEISQLVKYGVNTFKVTYQTIYKGNPIEASGLIYVPKELKGPAPMVSLQHGTTFVKSAAPSAGGDFTGMEYFASAGYIALMPDYLGYGSSSQIFHPYYDEAHSARTVIDFIKSAQEFLASKKIEINDELFLAGYSEGGYVTLATAYELEQNPAHRLSVKAVAAGAGGYDLNEMLKSVTTSSQYSYPAYLAFVIMAYNETNGWKKPLTYFFQEKYAHALATYMDGTYDGWQINSRLTTDVAKLLEPGFYSRLKSPDGELEFKAALAENSIQGWTSKTPIRLYHGTRDEIIPYQNSEVTLEGFKAKGSGDVSLTLIPNGSHGSAFIPMLRQFVPWFESIRNKN